MRIYFSGIGGVGIGPLAEIAHDAGYQAVGSDAAPGLVTQELESRGITVYLSQDGTALRQEHEDSPFDWFVYTAALPPHHPELVLAQQLGIKTAKRDELLATIISEKNLKLIAVSGTHGKTTTSGMLVWAMKQLGIPVSYSVGTTLSFGPSGEFNPASQYFVYECDEFDRNFLHFNPYISIITALDYDHPDTYPTQDEYRQAFVQFLEQSELSFLWEKDLRYLKQPDIAATYSAFDELMDLSRITLAGDHTRHNAFLAEKVLEKIASDSTAISQAINSFPGTNRRFERLAEGLYSDYGHHPVEIAATLQMAKELADDTVLIYQPHQNVRQHEIKHLYTDEIFKDASEVYWTSTYLSREHQDLEVLTPDELTKGLDSTEVHLTELNEQLWQHILRHLERGQLVLCMGAGSIDGWIRTQLASQS